MTKTSTAPVVTNTVGHITVVSDLDGKYIGRVTRISLSTFRASRIVGQTDVDIRKMSNFRSHETAVAFIAKIA